MPKTKADNRARLLHAAEKVTYRYGFGNTALADIAKKSKIPLGKGQHYFQNKDQLRRAFKDVPLFASSDDVSFCRRACLIYTMKLSQSTDCRTAQSRRGKQTAHDGTCPDP